MSRTINDIYNEMLTAKNAKAELSALNSTSNVAIWRLLLYVVAVAIWTFEQLLDLTKLDLAKRIQAQQIHSLTWYSDLAKRFQLGHSLPFGEVVYDTIDEDAQIVKYCSVTNTQGGLRVKIAGESAGALAPITTENFAAFQGYMEKVKAAGDMLFYTNQIADDLKIVATIYYDPLILDANGERLDGTNATPVQDAIEAFITSMDFDGRLIPAKLVDALQAVDGVMLPDVLSIQTKYALLSYADVPATGVVPDAGYLKLSVLTLNYQAWQ